MEAALCKSVLKPLREPIYQRLEKLHAGDGSQKLLAQNQVWTDGGVVGWMDGWMLSGEQEWLETAFVPSLGWGKRHTV